MNKLPRIMNDPDNIVDEMLEGFLKAHPDLVEGTENKRVVKAKNIPADKVGVVTGGGSGHKPAFIGYVGENLCDAAAVGEICSSPTAAAFLDSFKAADQGKGVACLYGNYSGDNMNVKMAVKMAARQGITVKTVVANDDVASAPKDQREKRRGVAGEVLMWKVGGAKAALGGTLDEVIDAAQKAIDHTRSVGIGLAPCTLPAVGHPNFTIEPATTANRASRFARWRTRPASPDACWTSSCPTIRSRTATKWSCWCPAWARRRSWSCTFFITRLRN